MLTVDRLMQPRSRALPSTPESLPAARELGFAAVIPLSQVRMPKCRKMQ